MKSESENSSYFWFPLSGIMYVSMQFIEVFFVNIRFLQFLRNKKKRCLYIIRLMIMNTDYVLFFTCVVLYGLAHKWVSMNALEYTRSSF